MPRLSSTSTFFPALPSMAAVTRPLWPPPIMIASYAIASLLSREDDHHCQPDYRQQRCTADQGNHAHAERKSARLEGGVHHLVLLSQLHQRHGPRHRHTVVGNRSVCVGSRQCFRRQLELVRECC